MLGGVQINIWGWLPRPGTIIIDDMGDVKPLGETEMGDKEVKIAALGRSGNGARNLMGHQKIEELLCPRRQREVFALRQT